jgi:NAD(P)-dependent dehydrogenase (short-subunit alcohol dehydrogenase family)
MASGSSVQVCRAHPWPASTIDAFVGPIGRQATPQEQAWPLVFLNSPRASYVNGETFTTDGGFFGALQTVQVDLSALFAGAGG